jgi:hypothetical protein
MEKGAFVFAGPTDMKDDQTPTVKKLERRDER